MTTQGYVAFDLGAESGRAMLATLDGQKLQLEEIHRFANLPQRLPSGLHWNLIDLWANLVEGLRKTGQATAGKGIELASLGVDTWGVDFGLIGRSGQLLGLPFAYRDDRNPPAMEKVFASLGADAIYRITGIQHMPFNSIYQLVAQHDAEPGLLAQVDRMLFMPDLLHYFFSGNAVNEATIASTSQMVNPISGQWATKLLTDLGLPHGFLGTIVPAGTKIGLLRKDVAQLAGVGALDVTVPGSHDTASAIAAVPVDVQKHPDWAYISSGTWSLIGAELDQPVVNDASAKANYTNERGVAGKIRFLKNVAGLWLVQECRRDLARQGQDFDYATLAKLAGEAEPFRTLIDPDHAPFASPGDMLAKMRRFAQDTSQPHPETPGQFVRACLESLALTYRVVLDRLDEMLHRKTQVLHIVGGGGRNTLLNQMTADAVGRPVIVGPFEATAIGNALTQAIGRGQVRDLAHLRSIVSASFDPQTFAPRNAAAMDKQLPRFLALCAK
ncbi:MAG: rhamnulokinase [Phycisphaeraceae bacterium]|nr:rhamnulokinase [Phycisphaeraceae bacterium]